MKRYQTMIGLLCIAVSWPAIGTAGPCDAYYKFDGTLADSSGNGYDGEMIDAEGAPAKPSFTEGRFGQALRLDGSGAMRSFLDLHYDGCPQVTISAWIRVDRDATDNTMHILSSGRGSGPGLRISGTFMALNGTENGLPVWDAIRRGSNWMFVAGVYDYESGSYTLHWQSRKTPPAELSPHRYPPENAFWVGTLTDENGSIASGVTIDELRVTGRAVADEQIAALRSGPQDTLVAASAIQAQNGPSQLPGDQYEPTQLPGDQYEPTQLPGDQYDPNLLPAVQDQLPGDRAGRNAGIDYERPPDLISDSGSGSSTERDLTSVDYDRGPDLIGQIGGNGDSTAEADTEPAPEPESDASSLKPGPTGERSYSDVSGRSGTYTRAVELDNGFVTAIHWWESSDRPCKLQVDGWGPYYSADGYQKRSTTELFGNNCGGGTALFSGSASVFLSVNQSAIGRIQVCNNVNRNHRLKGLRIWGDRINDDGTTTYVSDNSDTESLTNCESWDDDVLCPIGTQATGLRVHTTEASGQNQQITGLQLICRSIVAPGQI